MNKRSWIGVCALSYLLDSACGEDEGGADTSPSGPTDANSDASQRTDGAVAIEGEAGTGDAGVVVQQGTATPSGGRSLNGVCSPGAGPSAASLGSALQVLATSNADFAGPTFDVTGVYFGDDEAIYRIAPGAQTPAVFLATPGETYAPSIRGEYMYTGHSEDTDGGVATVLERRPFATPSATPEELASSTAYEITYDDHHLYTFDRAEAGFYRTAFGASTRELFAADEQGENLQVHGDYLYYVRWTQGSDQIARIPLARGAVEPVVSDPDAINLASYLVADDGIYWSDWHGGHFAAFGSPRETKTFIGLGNGGGLQNYLYFDRMIGDRIYWTLDDFPDSSYGWSKRDGSDCAIVLTDESAQANDDGYAYGTRGNFPRELFRVPLPH